VCVAFDVVPGFGFKYLELLGIGPKEGSIIFGFLIFRVRGSYDPFLYIYLS